VDNLPAPSPWSGRSCRSAPAWSSARGPGLTPEMVAACDSLGRDHPVRLHPLDERGARRDRVYAWGSAGRDAADAPAASTRLTPGAVNLGDVMASASDTVDGTTAPTRRSASEPSPLRRWSAARGPQVASARTRAVLGGDRAALGVSKQAVHRSTPAHLTRIEAPCSNASPPPPAPPSSAPGPRRRAGHTEIGAADLLPACSTTPPASPPGSSPTRASPGRGSCHHRGGVDDDDAAALGSLGIDLEAVRQRARADVRPGCPRPPPTTAPRAVRPPQQRRHLPFTREAKSASCSPSARRSQRAPFAGHRARLPRPARHRGGHRAACARSRLGVAEDRAALRRRVLAERARAA
jgi:hypothetical protein